MSDQRSSPTTPTVRFLLHGAERSGPPIYLLRLLREWHRQPRRFDVEVLVARPGPLLDDIRSVAPTLVARLDRRSPERIAQRGLSAIRLPSAGATLVDAATARRARGREFDITVVNGATQPTVDLLRAVDPRGEVVLIAHELSTGWCHNIDARSRRLLLERVERYLAVSLAVADYLHQQVGVPADRITVCRPPVGGARPASAPGGSFDRWPSAGAAAYTRRGSDAAVVVGGAGVHDWRKAPELWLQMAARVRRQLGSEAVRFVWFGGTPVGTVPSWPIRHEVRHLGLEDCVQFVGEVDELEPHLDTVDVFVSTAREDAYPLVCAEACATGVPVVTFDCGGAAELVADSGCGATVGYPDLDAMADRVVELSQDPARRDSLGRSGRTFAAEHLAPPVIAPIVQDWILAGSSS